MAGNALDCTGANLTTTNVQAGGANWTAAIWKTNGAGAAVGPPISGNTYQCVPNGIPFGAGFNNTRIRNPAVSGLVTFGGDSLTLNTNTELRMKQPGAVLNFPGAAGNAGLKLNGGVLNVGDETVFTITGKVQVLSQSYLFPADAGTGELRPQRGVEIAGQLTGPGTLVLMQATNVVPQTISGSSNTFSGQWIVKAGWLQGSSLNSLGTNSIIVDPNYVLGLDPSIPDVAGPAILEPGYDLNSAGTLVLTNGGILKLHQNCVFSRVVVEGVVLSSGTHPYTQLVTSFPSNFASDGSGTITVQPFGPPPVFPPVILTQPAALSANLGSPGQLVVVASGQSLSFQWQKMGGAAFTNLVDRSGLVGARTNQLTFSALALGDAGNYRVIVSNSAGALTSQVASVTVLVPDASRPFVTSVDPSNGASLATLTSIDVTFNEVVVGVQPGDLLINGAPATTLSGAGSNYVFSFSQPLPGAILVAWDSENAITDLNGNPLDPGVPWNYTLQDNVPPFVLKTVPASLASLSQLLQVQVSFTEPVTGVDAPDLLVNGGPAAQVSGAGAGPYLFAFPEPPVGSVTFSWAPNHGIRDFSSNVFAGLTWSVIVDPSLSASSTNVVINEILAANISTNGLRDEDFELSDWIELLNRGTRPVNLTGWSLTDDSSEPQKWSFPPTNIAPGQYLVIFASGKNRAVTGAPLHTNFRLNSGGDYLGLYNSDLPPRAAYEYAPRYPEQRNDISFGSDTANTLRYFSTPTPGAPNGSSTLTGAVAEVHFSVNHGFFDRPFNLILTSETPGADLYYTTDGSEPYVDAGTTNGYRYSGPVNISQTAVVRAAGFRSGFLPSQTETRSYFFPEDTVHQSAAPPGYPTGNVWTPTPGVIQSGSRAYYQMDPVIVNDPQYSNTVRSGLLSLPTLSLVLPIPDLFDPVNGIYTHPMSRGPAWERACSAEWVFSDGSEAPRLDCGLQIQGGTQREPGKNAKHSFRVSFKGAYGPGRLTFPIFPDSPIASYNTLVLDGGINMWWHYVGASAPADQRFRAQCVRDQFTSDLMLAIGHPACHGRFHHVYLNGLYWGLHYIHERPDEDFAASYLGGTSSDFDVLRTTTIGLEIVAGDTVAWNAALALCDAGLTNNARYLDLQQYVDIENLIDYMIVNHWVDNEDWPQHNWYVIRKRAPGEGFKFIVWDAEHVLKDVNANRTSADFAGSPAQIYNALRNNAEFRLRYADRLQKHFFNGGLFYSDPNPANALWDPAHPEKNVPASYYMKRIGEIDSAIVDESARWGGYLLTTNYTRNDHWVRELNNLLGFTNTPGNTPNFFPLRSANVLNQYKSIGLFPIVSAPVLSRYGGAVPPGFLLSISNSNSGGTVFYTTNGSDPRLFGSGAVSLDARPFTAGTPINLAGNVRVQARVLMNGTWSALTSADFQTALLGVPMRITEIMYKPVGGDAYEFIELQNTGPNSVDLTGCSFTGIAFTFPDNFKVPPGGVIVLASSVNPAAFASRYPGVVVAGYYGGALFNNGERIALLDRFQNTIVSVDYSNTGGWPVNADGQGFSLEIIDPNADPDDPANWRASTALNGSPGLVNPPAALPEVRINEIMADNAGAVTNGLTFPDWVELFNAGPNSVDLANWSLSNSGNPRKFIFPQGITLPGNAYLTVWCDSETNAPGLHTGFALGRKGESLFLYDPLTNRVDAVSFGPQVANYSIGRIGAQGAWQLNVPTPWTNNLPATLAPLTNLAINEWLANAAPGSSDWLELFNRSASPVALQGLYFTTSNDLFQIRSLSFCPPRGFVQLFADENPGPDHLDFKLAASGDSLRLLDLSGQLLDAVTFSAQPEAISQGRLPDGAAAIVSFPGSASPGASNYVVAYAGPFLNEIMARNTSAVYDARGNTPDWLELANPFATNASLAGLRLGNAAGQSWAFPADAVIAANGFLLVWCNPSLTPSTNSATELNAAFALNADGDSVYLFNSAGQVVDAVTYGIQISDRSIGRFAGTWRLLTTPSPRAANSSPAPLGSPANVKINEWMANPQTGDSWFELYSSDALPVDLGGLYLTDDPSMSGLRKYQVPPLSFVAAKSWMKFDADSHPSKGASHTSFSLDADGESLRLYSTNLQILDSIDFPLQAHGVSQGRLPDGASTVVNFPSSSSPAASNFLPLENIFVNEVLAHTDPPLEDAIEFFNSGSTDLPIGGWFLSNSESDFKKFRIPPSSVLAAGQYAVFYEYQFNSTNAVPFTLNSAHGDSVFLSQADSAGNLTGFRAQVSFGASENDVSWGRILTSQGADFVPLVARTFGSDNPVTLSQFRTGSGQSNASPRIGPVVITEIMYHPVTLTGTNLAEDPADEFIEIANLTPDSVPLYDPAIPANTWSVAGGVSFVFPAGAALAPYQYALLVSFNPAMDPAADTAFRAKYNLANNITLFGPFSGRLNNAGETIELYKPDPPQAAPHPDAGFVPSIVVDRVVYTPSAPWPDGASGTGLSLQRRLPNLYGNEPLNWLACSPTPGAPNCGVDSDHDGLPDDWELANGLNPNSALGDDGPNGDPDRDGFSNLQEYLAGTDPRDPLGFLCLNISPMASGVKLSFSAIAAHSYTIQYRDNLQTGAWQNLASFDPAPTNSSVQLPDVTNLAGPRFYRLVTPRLP